MMLTYILSHFPVVLVSHQSIPSSYFNFIYFFFVCLRLGYKPFLMCDPPLSVERVPSISLGMCVRSLADCFAAQELCR